MLFSCMLINFRGKMCLCCHERGQNSFRFPSMKSRRTETDVHKRCDHTVSFQVSFRVGKRRDYPPKTFTKISSIIWLMTPKEKRIGFFSLCLLLKLRGCSRERQCIVSIPLTALLLCNTQIKGLKCFTFEEKPNHLVTVSIWQCKNTQDLGCLI